MSVAINMPQMAAGGLSENWLFRHCGDLHWQALCRSLGVRSAQLQSAEGTRLYASFVAISARYTQPLSIVRENEVLEEQVSIARYGSAFYQGQITLCGDRMRIDHEMITAFVARTEEGRNNLRKSVPGPQFDYRDRVITEAPPLLTRAAELRKRSVRTIRIDSFAISLDAASLDVEMVYEPTPYIDYNGANLLYYASYPSICDFAERQLIGRHRLMPEIATDWVLAASTIARDVFYYRNLDLGDAVVVRLEQLKREDDKVLLHSRILRASDRDVIGETFTVKALRSVGSDASEAS